MDEDDFDGEWRGTYKSQDPNRNANRAYMHTHCRINRCFGDGACNCSCYSCRTLQSREQTARNQKVPAVPEVAGYPPQHCHNFQNGCEYPCHCGCMGCQHQRKLKLDMENAHARRCEAQRKKLDYLAKKKKQEEEGELTKQRVIDTAAAAMFGTTKKKPSKKKIEEDLDAMLRDLSEEDDNDKFEKKKKEEEKPNMANVKAYDDDEDYTKPTVATVTDALKRDMGEAAWRTAGATVVDAVHQPLVAAIAGNTDSDRAKMFAGYLMSKEGRAILGTLLGMAPLIVPQLADDPRIEKLAQEMRIQGLQNISDKVAKDLAQPIIDAFTKAVANLPELPARTK